MYGSISLISMLAHDLSCKMQLILPIVNRQTGNLHFIFAQKYVHHIGPANPLRDVNICNIFTQSMLVGSWVKVGNIPLYKNIEASSFVIILTAFCTLKLCAFTLIRQIRLSLDKSILHYLVVKLSCGILKKARFTR